MGFFFLSHISSSSFIKSVLVLIKREFPHLIYLKYCLSPRHLQRNPQLKFKAYKHCSKPSSFKVGVNNCISIWILLRGSSFFSITLKIPACVGFVS